VNVILDASVTLGTLLIDASNDYTLSSTGTVTMQTSVGNPAINVIGGKQTISIAALSLAGPLDVDVSGGSLSIQSPIHEAATGMGLTKSGAGTLVLIGSNTYSGGTTVLDGTLIVTDKNSLRDGTCLNIGSAAGIFLPPIDQVDSIPEVSPVPESGSLALLSTGLLLLISPGVYMNCLKRRAIENRRHIATTSACRDNANIGC
jgi:autotransporter-associated beta strand protein